MSAEQDETTQPRMKWIEVTSGRRRVQGNGAPWEAWAIDPRHDLPVGHVSVPFGGWGATRAEAEEMAVRALKEDRRAARAGYVDVKTRTIYY